MHSTSSINDSAKDDADDILLTASSSTSSVSRLATRLSKSSTSPSSVDVSFDPSPPFKPRHAPSSAFGGVAGVEFPSDIISAARAAARITSSASSMLLLSSLLNLLGTSPPSEFKPSISLSVSPDGAHSSITDPPAPSTVKGEEPPSSSATEKLDAATLSSLTEAASFQNLGFNAAAAEIIFGAADGFFFLDPVDGGAMSSMGMHRRLEGGGDSRRDPRVESRSTYSTEDGSRFNLSPDDGGGIDCDRDVSGEPYVS